MKNNYLLGLVVTLFGFVMSPSIAFSQQKKLQDQMVGTWQTVSVIHEQKAGTKFDVLNRRMNGRSIYTADGRFFQMNTRTDTPKIASGNQQTATSEESQSIVRHTYAAFGDYTVNEADGSVSVKFLGSTLPNEVGKNIVRKVNVNGDAMTFLNPSTTSIGKTAINTFKRVR